jgi:GntR family transcriptional regulator
MADSIYNISGNHVEKLSLTAKDAPIYVQIREDIRQKILSGFYEPGQYIPSEKDIANSWNANRLTARQAVISLIHEGYLSRRPGIGTFVVERKSLLEVGIYLASFWEHITSLGMKPSSRLIGKEIIPQANDLAIRLEIAKESPVYYLRRVRLANDEPLAFQINYIPVQLIPNLMEEDIITNSLYAVYRKNGIFPAIGEQRIEARIAEPGICELLDISAKSPILYVESLTRSINHKPIEFTQAYYRADRYSVVMQMHT